MTRMQRIAAVLGAFSTMLLSPTALASYGYNMTEGVTPISHQIYHLHMTIFTVCVAIAVVVFGVMFYSLIFHRKSRGYVAADFHEHPVLEVLWAIVPFVILVAMAIPATQVLISMDSSEEPDLTIKVTGYQWKWRYEYLDENISFFSNLSTPLEQITNRDLKKNQWYLAEVDNEVVVPINKKIRFLVTANDVIHSWWVPALGVKRDAMPGFIHEAWAKIQKPGVYRGQCAELCGLNHGYMPIVVRAVTDTEYAAWVKERHPEQVPPPSATVPVALNVVVAGSASAPTPPVEVKIAVKVVQKDLSNDELMQKGKATYEKICAVCHKVDGTGTPPMFPPLKGSSIAVGKPISRHILRVLNGVDGTAMQAFASQLTDEEIASVVTYERNSWGNNTGDLVQPKDVAALRGTK